MTKADEIRNYSDEELVDFIYSIYLSGKISEAIQDNLGSSISCMDEPEDVLHWLQSEVTKY